MINIIFPSSPLSKKTIAPFWEKESKYAEEAGFGISLASDPNFAGAISLTNKTDAALYRGWIVKPSYYKELCEAAEKSLLTSYDNYLWSYEFPRWYPVLGKEETPESFTFTGDEIAEFGLEEIAVRVGKRAGSQPLIIKDWLKSRKHEWYDACFIKDASDKEECIRVMSNFFRLQGRDFYGGLVFRQFLSLKKLGTHPKSGMPMPIEFRTFFLNQKPMMTMPYWQNDMSYPLLNEMEVPPTHWLEEIGKKMVSPFVALDIAQSDDDKWWVIEVNDGGTAGYPDSVDSVEFYSSILNGIT